MRKQLTALLVASALTLLVLFLMSSAGNAVARQFLALESASQTRIKLACGVLLLLVNGVLAVVVVRRKLRARRGRAG